MPKFFLFLVLFFFAFGGTCYADDMYAACDSYPDVPVRVTARFDEPVYDFTAGISEITAKSQDLHHSIRETMTLGLTQYQPVLEIYAAIAGVRLPDGLACAHVDHVDVTFGYKDVKVYVGKEFPQGSCGFNEVLAHEQKHINVNKKILDTYSPRIAKELGDYLKLNGVFREVDEDYARAVLHEKMQTVVNAIVRELVKENNYRQQDVDTSFEYNRISGSCNGEVQRVTMQHHMQPRR